MVIEVGLFSMMQKCNVIADTKTGKATNLGEPIKLDAEQFARRVCDIIQDWEPNLHDPNLLDGLEYSISVKDDKKNYKFIGNSRFPDNFRDLIELLKEINVWH